jgi:hypothetical protein
MCFVEGKMKTIEERFWGKVNKNGPFCKRLNSFCWNWTGSTRLGYGLLADKDKHLTAHRFSWEIHYGKIPIGLCVCHTCDNPTCVRPDHLFIGTRSDNMRDMVNKGRSIIPRIHGENHPFAKLKIPQVLAIRASNLSIIELAEDYGVSITTITCIRKHLTWKDIP